MSLDFRNTCPEIDDKISDFEYHLENFLDSLIPQFIPSSLLNANGVEYKSFKQEWMDDLKNQVIPLFEDLRELNAEMRATADKQIEELYQRIDSLEWDKEELKEKILELENYGN